MTTFAVDPETNDIMLVNNSISVLKGGPDETAQRLRARLKFWRAEWFLDLTKGTPYRETIFAVGVTAEARAAAIKREILTTPGVEVLLSYDQSIDNVTRKMTVSFSVKSTDGEIIDFSEEIP